MFYLPLDGSRQGGGCNFAIVLTLLCVVDGIARDVYPTKAAVDEHEKRFKRLLREKLFWGPPEKGWIEKSEAARQFYLEFRNPLVHDLGKDNPSSARPAGFLEPNAEKWGRIPSDKQNIDYIDGLMDWDLDWATLYIQETETGSRYKLSSASLYWSVKRMVAELAQGVGQ